ncbi:MAG TPA: ribonuclease P protein component [Planctomycetota bacterium]|nr:ribonuclease P protein component [Planctomycetota bacterium]
MSTAKRLGLPPAARLKTQSDYDRVHRTGLKFHGRLFLARVDVFPDEVSPAGPTRDPRLGLRVAKRHGSAVERNRIKRLLREGFRRSRREWEYAADVVLIPKTQGWNEVKLRDLQEDFERLERQIRRFAQDLKREKK